MAQQMLRPPCSDSSWLPFLMEMVVIVWMNNSGGLCAHTCAVERQACESSGEPPRAVCLGSACFLGNQGFRSISDCDKCYLFSLLPIHAFIPFELPCF